MADTAIDPGPAVLILTGPAPLTVQAYSSTINLPELSSQRLRNLFPDQRVPIDSTGQFSMSNEYYRAFRYIVDILLNGVNAIPLEQIVAAINNSTNNIARITALTEAVERMTVQNAAALASTVLKVQQTVEAVQNSTPLPTTADIPPVQTHLNESPGGD